MTTNQVAYWTMLEQNRHNLETEEASLIGANAAATSAAAAWKQAETQRSLVESQKRVNEANKKLLEAQTNYQNANTGYIGHKRNVETSAEIRNWVTGVSGETREWVELVPTLLGLGTTKPTVTGPGG